MKFYLFKNCTVRADLARGYTETIFRDGTKVPAYPNGESDQKNSATELGYGQDVSAMCREHEILHTWLCELFGLPHSPTLWAVAHGFPEGAAPLSAQYEEEALVLAFQGYMNGKPPSAALDALTGKGFGLEQLRRQALNFLRKDQSHQAAA